ncbi:heparinase II/III domain-containing protein [Paenibacillus sp. JDR-2]|uniref:heparinase II/III domain-containing protein n=1 Tax=Paenibacillus sp. (strain JDR-2) TaxID=324057 RepID=UPI000166A5E8|nr:heparinase II/III family protein [Paenibacillus sp. JDR-2]ACT00641.1 Heparinase II/III family protein [Paenibacillus sp. JDR-2]
MTGVTPREQLKELVDQAIHLLVSEGNYYTDGAKLALMDMVKAAEQALQGQEQVPFIRNREFIAPSSEGAVRFAHKRFTMVPSYNPGAKIYQSYGLEPALAWFEQQDMRREEEQTLAEKAEFVVEKARSLLDGAEVGSGIGQYDAAAREALIQAIEQVEQASSAGSLSDKDLLAQAIVQGFNRIRELHYSKVLRTDIESESSLYLTKEQLLEVKGNAENDPLIKALAKQIKQNADSYSLAYIEKASELIMQDENDYDEINKHFYVWSTTDKIVNFIAPEKAVTAELAFILPSIENEQDGLGHVWIDNLDILSASGGSFDICNNGFDEGSSCPDYWRTEARKGIPIMKWEDRYPYCGGGSRTGQDTANPSSQAAFTYKENTAFHSLYLCNPTGEDEAAWVYDGEFSVQGGIGYTLTFAAKIDGKLKQGLKTLIVFKDENGQELERFDYLFNRKSSLPNGCFQLTMQCDAIQYAFTKHREYAMKAKHALLYTLNDFCQGAEHWLITNLRPQGSDSYGAVQGGRLLCSAAVTYSMIKEAAVFTAEEKTRLYAMVEYLLRYMIDLRDRTELSPYDAQYGSGNWQTDMCAGTAYMMLVLDDFPNRKTWLYNAHVVLHAQLMQTVNPDSSWPESIRYHHAALERFAGYAKVTRHMMGENWFQDTPLASMFGFSLRTQTPAYRYFDNRIGTPPFGDHALSGGAEFGSFGPYIGDIEQLDKELADRMYHTWRLAGKPFKKLWGEGIVLDNLLGKGDSYEPEHPLKLDSINDLVHAGIYIFRNHMDSERQSYMAIMSSPEPIGHGHLDQGSFVLYKDSIPLVMDSGIEGYFDSSTSWHISSYSHACMQFATKRTQVDKSGQGAINLTAGTYSLERGWVDVPRVSRVLDSQIGGDVEQITIEIANPEGEGKHIRHIRYYKRYDLYLIQDKVEGYDGELLFNLPVAAKHSEIEGNRVYSSGIYDVDLETVFLSPVKSMRIEKGRSTPVFDCGDTCMMDYIRAKADAKDGFTVLLYPKRADEKRLEVFLQQNGLVQAKIQNELLELDIAHE